MGLPKRSPATRALTSSTAATGADTLIGGAGNDTYIVDDAGDIVTEVAGGGTADRVQAAASYVLGESADVEFLETTNAALTAAINLTGNGLAQTLTGNAGANVLDGGAGIDTLVGGAGNDTINGGDGIDTFEFYPVSGWITPF